MGRLFDDASSQYLTVDAGIVSGVEPLSMSAMFYADAAVNAVLLTVGTAGTANHRHALQVSSAQKVQAFSRGTVNAEASTTTSFSLNTWHHACGLWISDALRRAYLDAGGEGGNSASEAVNVPNICRISSRSGSATNFMSGRIAEVGIWNIRLTLGEIAHLSRGVPPSQIRPGHLKGYWPLVRPGFLALDKSGNGNHMSEVNGPIASSAHPPLKTNHAREGVVAIPPYRPVGAVLEDWGGRGNEAESGG